MTKPSSPEKRARKKRKFNETDEEPEGEDSGDGGDEDQLRDSWTRTFSPSSALHLVEPTKPQLSWDDYIAEDSVKEALRKVCSPETNNVDLLQQVKNKIQCATTGSTSVESSHNHQALLLYGPPGNGKTHAVRVMACQAAPREVYEVNLTSIKSTWCNQTENQLQLLLAYIATKKNAIVFIDEIDSFVGEQNRGDRHNAPLLTEFLRWLNGLFTDPSSNLTMIFATNVKHLCSPAFLSRCATQIEVRPPSQELRLKWWKTHARHLKLSELAKLAAFQFESFRDLSQLVDSVVLAESIRLMQTYGEGCRYAGIVAPPTYDRYLQAAIEQMKSLQKTESPNATAKEASTVADHSRLLDEVKTIAAATAASTFAALNADAPTDQKKGKRGQTPSKAAASDSKVVALEKTVAGLQTRVVDLETEKNSRELKIVSLEGEITRLQDAGKMEKSIKDGQGKSISKLETQVGKNKRKEEELERELTNTRLRVIKLQTKVSELEGWESATAQWIIEDFSVFRLNQKPLRTNVVPIAGREMNLSLSWNAKGSLGLFINHVGGLTWTPISIGSSSLAVEAKTSSSRKSRVLTGGADIGKCYGGLGWNEFLLPNEIDKHVSDNKLTVVATIRVQRVTGARCTLRTTK